MIGKFATSKAGHDKTKLYIIIDEELEYVYLVDGDLKPLDKPKKKSKKHIQIINKVDEIIQNKIDEISSFFSMQNFSIINISFLKNGRSW